MTATRENDRRQLDRLIDGLCDQTLSADELTDLGQRLVEDAEARDRYMACMELHGRLAWQTAPGRQFSAAELQRYAEADDAGGKEGREEWGEGRGLDTSVPSTVASGQSAVFDDPPSALRPPPSPVPFIVVDHTLPSPLSSLPSFLFSYTVAAIIVGMGILVGHLCKVTHYTEFARSFGTPSSPATIEQPARVARITGMVDVKWGKQGLGIRDWGLEEGSGFRGQGSGVENPEIPKSRNPQIPKSPVRLGDKFALVSGLLQLTYDSGAKVILQGPCTYQVDSAAGGFLSLGKLTARVEKGSGVRGQGSGKVAGGQWSVASKSTINNQQSTINNPSLSPFPPPPSPFVVKTPTATITDLGTEFGVEVDKHGVCEVQVLRGLVRAEFFAAPGRPSQTVELIEGQGRRYEPASDQVAAIPVDRAGFADMRIVSPYRRWLEYSRKLRSDPALVAYYTFDKHDRGTSILPNQSLAGSALDGLVEGAEWVNGRLPGKLALYFHGPGSGDKAILPEQERFRLADSFSVAVWFKAERFTGRWQALIAKGDNSWRLQQSLGADQLSFDTDHEPASSENHDLAVSKSEVADGRWHLAVAVYESVGATAHKRLYIDGSLESESHVSGSLSQNDQPVWIGANSMRPDREFQGPIDEVAIFARALSADEARAMFEAGNPARPRKRKGASQ